MDRQTIDHIARLARLGVKDADRTRYEGQLAAILGHFEAMKHLDGPADNTSGSTSEKAPNGPPEGAPADVNPAPSGRTRADVPREDHDGAAIVDLAADREERSFRVPRVLE